MATALHVLLSLLLYFHHCCISLITLLLSAFLVYFGHFAISQPAVSAFKLKAAPKPQPSHATAGSPVPPRPKFSSNTTSDRKMTNAKAPLRATTTPTRPSSTAASATASSATIASRDPKPKVWFFCHYRNT